MPQDNQAETQFGLDPGAPDTGFARPGDFVEAGPPFARGRFDGENAIAVCDGLIDLLAIFFNVSSRQLRSASRTALPVSRVRQIGMYIAHVTLGMKMTAVGAGFGRDKSTVVHACHTIEDLRDDEDFDLIVGRMEKLVTIAFSLERQAVRPDG